MDKTLRDIIAAHYDKCVARIIYRLRRIPANDLDQTDSPMRTIWDHWKREMQEEHSICHGLIEDVVEKEVQWLVQNLPDEQGALLTMLTDEFDELQSQQGDGPVLLPDAVANELMSRLNQHASDEPHRREVQRWLDDIALDRFERG